MSTRIGLVGCGVIAKVYAEKINALPFVELRACADVLPDRAVAFAAAHGTEALPLDRLLEGDDVDVVLNLTVPGAHYDVTWRALESGKSVFSEKPLAVTFEEGQALVATAASRSVRLGCAPDTFLGAGLQTCRKLIDEGAIGEPVAANGFMLSPGPEAWHPGPAIFYQRGAGPLFDMGPYYLTALAVLLGPARRITASARITRKVRTIGSEPLRGQRIDVEVPTHVSAVIDYATGPVATLTTSFDVQASRHRFLEVQGTEGTLSVPDPNTFGGDVQIRRSYRHDWETVPLTHGNGKQSRGLGLADMVSAMQRGRPHRASGALALHVLETMEAAIRASEEGRHIVLTSTCERPAPLPAGLPDDTFED
jgi:predicted dehydrogenase